MTAFKTKIYSFNRNIHEIIFYCVVAKQVYEMINWKTNRRVCALYDPILQTAKMAKDTHWALNLQHESQGFASWAVSKVSVGLNMLST